MAPPLWLFALFMSHAIGSTDNVGRQSVYELSLVPHQGESPGTTVHLMTSCVAADDRSVDQFWYLASDDENQLPWPHRLGQWSFDRQSGQVESHPPRIVVRDEGVKYRVDVPVPLIRIPVAREEGARWLDGPATFELAAYETMSKIECWRIQAEDGFGSTSSIWVEHDSDRVVAMNKTVIVGRGVPYRLQLKLTDQVDVPAGQLADLERQIEILLSAAADQELDYERSDWSLDAEEQEIILDQLESIEAMDGERSVAAARANGLAAVARISRRVRSVESLRNAIVGKPVPSFELFDIDGERVSDESLAGKTIVLHIWKYRNENLDPPYGQIGFLDFLARRRDEEQVVVLGITQVTPAAANGREHRIQIESARKLREFMNLSYPIAIDDGSLLREIGDPARAKESLPLWIVVRPDGVVSEYQVGLLDVDANRGLEIVNRWIAEAAKDD